jgi:hypothetical protein
MHLAIARETGFTGCGTTLCKPFGVYFLVEAPAFMRGKERFSAPGKVRL